MTKAIQSILAPLALTCTVAVAQEITVLRDLDTQGRVTLTKDELSQLMPSAKLSRVTVKGNTHFWKNESGGSFIVSSNNMSKSGRVSTAQGKWHISEDGRYCVLMEWKVEPTEEWCRYIIKAGDAYYATKSDKLGSEKVYKLEITK